MLDTFNSASRLFIVPRFGYSFFMMPKEMTPVLLSAFLISNFALAGTPTANQSAKAAASIANATPAPAASKKGQALTVKNGTIEFFAIGKPSMLKIHGVSNAMSGTMNHDGDALSGSLEIPLDSFETGMKVRNDHLKEKIFETTKYQKAVLTISSLVLPVGKTGEIKGIPFNGKLNMHGVEKDVSGSVTVTPSDKEVGFDAEFQVKLTDFQIPPPEFMGMTIQDQVRVSAKGKGQL